MVLRALIILLTINLILIVIILMGRSSGKQKIGWSSVLLAVPLIGLAIYYFLNKKDAVASTKDWESK